MVVGFFSFKASICLDLNTCIKNAIELILHRHVGGESECLCNQTVAGSIFKHPRHLLKSFSNRYTPSYLSGVTVGERKIHTSKI